MDPQVQTALLNTYSQKMIATNLKALREQITENDQWNAAEEIAVPEILNEYDQILRDGVGFWDDVNGGYSHSLPWYEFIVSHARDLDTLEI